MIPRHANLTLVLLIVFCAIIFGGASLFAADDTLPAIFRTLPKDWSLKSSIVVPESQGTAIGQRLGGKIEGLTNSVLAKNGQTIQINVVECASDEAAQRIEQAILKTKSNPRLVYRNGKTVYEFVARTQDNVLLALAARYELGIQPRRAVYKVRFDVAPIKSGDAMEWNSLFQAFLLFSEDESKSEGKSRIEELSKSFEFSDRIQLRAVGQGKQESKWTFDPEPVEFAKATSGDIDDCRFANLPKRAGVPFVVVSGEIVSETGARTPASGKSTSDLTKATSRWPVDDPEVKKLAAEITTGCKTPREKVDALLRWLLPGKNIRFEGPVVGSRWGVKKVLDQHFGHCWDFSDVFVTLCRASDIPCRQVLGWLYGSEGHVWAEVLVDDAGWLAVDPTTSGPCGSDYVPFVSTTDGEMPLVYASPVSIEVENAQSPGVE